jgi:hypothetical protein
MKVENEQSDAQRPGSLTDAEFTIDPATVRRMDAWLQNVLGYELGEIEDKRAAMLDLVASDPDYWTNLGWRRVYDEAGQPLPPASASGAEDERDPPM